MPTAAVPALMLKVDEPPAVTEVGLNDEVVPLGAPLTDSATLWAEPEVTAVEIVLVPLVACTRLRLVGLAEIEKSLTTGVVMVRERLVVWVALVPVPVTVRL